MLKDPKSDRLIVNFAREWLGTRATVDVAPDRELFPSFDDTLRLSVEAGAVEPQRVSLAGSQRIGLLTQTSFLSATSYPQRTSPVKRGAWVLEQLLCSPPPPPPPTSTPPSSRRSRPRT
jgi:Protein of unknown function (DUF1588)/Protein of unknown function (DUF1592)